MVRFSVGPRIAGQAVGIENAATHFAVQGIHLGIEGGGVYGVGRDPHFKEDEAHVVELLDGVVDVLEHVRGFEFLVDRDCDLSLYLFFLAAVVLIFDPGHVLIRLLGQGQLDDELGTVEDAGE